MHRLLRIFSTTLITAGLVILIDVGLTLVWKEPLSTIYGSIQQGRAEDQLAELEDRFPAADDLRAAAGAGSARVPERAGRQPRLPPWASHRAAWRPPQTPPGNRWRRTSSR